MQRLLFAKAHGEGCCIAINWQDQDSSSEKAFRAVYGPETSARVMKCGGHVGRAHGKALLDVKGKKEFGENYKSRHAANFPEVATVTCCCRKKRHSSGCGCITKEFIEGAKRNLFCAITQCGNNPEAFAQKMRILGKYHARGIHTWADGKCDFHPLLVCSCGNCENEEELKCEGKEYKSQKVLTCELHSLAYEIECCVRAENADEIVDPDLGRGHALKPV